MPTKLLDTSDVAKLLNMHVQTVRRYCRLNLIQASSISAGSGRGNRYRISLDAVDAFLRSRGHP